MSFLCRNTVDINIEFKAKKLSIKEISDTLPVAIN